MLKRSLTASLAGLLALAGLVFTAPAASAEPDPPGCSPGYFCAYAGPNYTGGLRFRTAGNWSGAVDGVMSLFNNGVPYPGADHVQVDWVWPSGNTGSICLHYNPGAGHGTNLIPYATITRVQWRGEC